jgi:hypothetical protein
MTCPHCSQIARVGPCQPDGDACNHDLRCPEHGVVGIESWNLALARREHDRVYRNEPPLFMEQTA